MTETMIGLNEQSMKYPVFFGMMLLLTACGGGESNQSNAEKLKALKAQQSAIEAQIADLEKQEVLANPGTQVQKTHVVSVEAVKLETFQHFIDLQGSVKAENSQPATSKMPGTLRKVYISEGSTVSRGQLIAELDDDVMRSSRGELENQLRFATDVFERQKGLWDQKIGTEIQFLQTKNQKEALEKSLSTLNEQMSMLKVYAPIGGTVDMLLLKAGQAIAPGMPLCNIINMGDLRVKGDVPETYAGKLKKGDRVLVFFPDLNKEISTTVTYVAKTINPLNRTILVECALPASDQYRANMIAVMKIVDYQKANAISIPAGLVRQSPMGDAVLVAGPDKIARQVKVSLGLNYNGRVEVLNGLSAGDQIINTGVQNVNEGDLLKY
jgi:membrane fusion protein, multidrug efflux system